MALNIPLPGVQGDVFGKAIDSGSTILHQMMQPILEREKQKQLEAHFQAQLGLSKAAAGRAAQAAADAHRIAMDKLDPTSGARRYEALENYFKSKGNAGAMSGGQMQQETMPSQEMGEGMGMFTPEGMQQAQQQPQATRKPRLFGPNGPDLELMKANPMLRGAYKKLTGIDPLAAVPQTPEEKQAAALDLFKQKEGVKAQNKGGDTPTNTVLTQNQQAIQGIDTVLPMLDDLIKNPDKVYGKWDFSPSKKAAYNAKTSGMIDTLVAAQSLPKVQASIDLVEQQIRRATNESDDAYIERIKDLRKDLVNRRGKAQSVIKNRKVNTESSEDYSNMSDEELRKIAGGG